MHGIVKADARRESGLRSDRMVGSRRARPRAIRRILGGQRQRIGIARALALNPRLIIADEPVSALDCRSRRDRHLLRDLQKKMSLTYLFIAHDLSVVEHITTAYRMYLVDRRARATSLFITTRGPLFGVAAVRYFADDPDSKKARIVLKGDVPNPANPPPGCRSIALLHGAADLLDEEPPLREVVPGHWSAATLRRKCH